jgi:integrase/recombinase XerD
MQPVDRIVLMDEWLVWKRYNEGCAVSTADKYRGYLVRLFQWMDKQHPPIQFEAVVPDQLDLFTGLESHKQGMSPRSRRALVAAVRGFYKWLDKRGVTKSNPAAALEYPDAGRALPIPASLATADKLIMAPDLATFAGVRDAAILGVLIGCGLRLSGLCRLNESHLVWYQDPGVKAQRLVLRITEKGGKDRVVPAPAETRVLLRAYLNHPDLDGIDRLLKNGDRVVFISVNNRRIPEHEYRGEQRRMRPRSVQSMILKYGLKLGLPLNELHPHAIRHLYGTELAEGSEDLLIRQALLGY